MDPVAQTQGHQSEPAGQVDGAFEEEAPLELEGPSVSVRDALRRRRQEILQQQPILLDVPSYDGLVAQYHLVDYKLQRRILNKYQRRNDQAEAEKLNAAENLVHACDDLLWREESGELRSLGHRWGGAFVAEFLDIQGCQNGIQALLAMFPAPADAQLVLHYGEFMEECKRVQPRLDEELAGESPAAGSATE